ncbi:MAG: YckD family protein [Bacillota bacterium]|nr:YckD family protein [Bacillota bacterium]
MRKLTVAMAVFLLMFVAALGVLPVNANDGMAVNTNETVQLTEAQQKELATLHKDILGKRKEVISKYVEFGVIPKEKGDKIITRLEKKYEKLEANGFIPKCEKSKCKRSNKEEVN